VSSRHWRVVKLWKSARTEHAYPHFHNLGHSVKIDILCGSRTCVRRAFISLTDEEEQQYLYGQRSLRVFNRAIDVHVR
jgi:hypothetical protein